METIHEREQLLQRIDELEEKLERQRLLMEASLEGIIIHYQGVIIYTNPAVRELTGFSSHELTGKRVIDLIEQECRDTIGDRFAEGSEWTIETVGIRKDGMAYFMEVNQRKSMFNGMPVNIVNFRDITDRKEIELQLENSFLENETLHKQLMDTKFAMDEHSAVVITDQKGMITYANERFCQETKYRNDELIGQTHRLLNSGHHPKEFFQELWQTITSGKVWKGEIKDKSKDGVEYWVDTTIVPFLNHQGEPYQYVAIQTNITEQKKVNEMKNEFVSIVSHELRTPLTTILGFMEILLNRNLSMEKIKRYVETVYKEANRLSDLINDFLDLQRMEAGRQEYHLMPVEITGLIRNLVEQWEGKQKHQIFVHMQEKNVYVRADVNRLRQVVHNLLSNAIKYSPGADQIDLYVEANNREVAIRIQDYGLGIPDEAREKMFTKFFRVDNSDRRKIGGTGLGLAIVKEIVEAHQGTIDFDSVFGEGSIFTVRLKNYPIEMMAGKIVIIEDDEGLTDLIRDALEKFSLPTVCYRSTEEAILAMELIKETEEQPLLCIVDIELEGTQTGWDFITHLYQHPVYNKTPVIVSTVLEPPRQYREKDTEKFLQKPFSIQKLIHMVEHLLNLQNEALSYIFPFQDQQTLASSLQENGIEVERIHVDLDTIKVEVKKRDTRAVPIQEKP